MTSTTNATTVKSDLVHDLHYHVEKGNCFVVTLLQDYDWEPVGYGNISVDTYIIADTDDHARFIVSGITLARLYTIPFEGGFTFLSALGPFFLCLTHDAVPIATTMHSQ